MEPGVGLDNPDHNWLLWIAWDVDGDGNDDVYRARENTDDDPQIDQDGDNEDHQTDAVQFTTGVSGPGEGQGGQRHEEETEKRPEQRIVRVADVVREDHHEDYRKARRT